VPPVATPATGSGTVLLNTSADTMTVNATFNGLSADATAVHVHGPAAAGADGGLIFPLDGVIATTSERVPDQSFAVTPARVAELEAGLHYFNVHTGSFPNGEIRGQIAILPQLTVAIRGTGASDGSEVRTVDGGITCGADCAESYESGTTVTLVAGAPRAGSLFSGWIGGGCSGPGSCVFIVTADTNVTAVYGLSSGATTFTDDPLTRNVTLVKAVHVLELRSAINSLRAANGLGAFAFTDPGLAAGGLVKAAHIVDLRTALNGVYTQRGAPVPTYTNSSLTAGQTPIRASDIAELRLTLNVAQ
jgi:hypothetical protein